MKDKMQLVFNIDFNKLQNFLLKGKSSQFKNKFEGLLESNKIECISLLDKEGLVGCLIYNKNIITYIEADNKNIGLLVDAFIDYAKKNFYKQVISYVSDYASFFEEAGFIKNDDHYLYNLDLDKLGKRFKAIVDIPYGGFHPYFDSIIKVNYGYVEENQDIISTYIYGVNYPLETFEGYLIGILTYEDTSESKWILAGDLSFDYKEVIDLIGPYEKQRVHIDWVRSK